MDGPVTFFQGPAQVLSDQWRSPSQFSKSACMLRSAYIRFSRRFSFGAVLGPMAFAPHSMAFIWLTMDASVTRQGYAKQKPERACRHTLLAICRMTRSLSWFEGKPLPAVWQGISCPRRGQWHHTVLAAQLCHRHAAFALTQDRKDLRLSVSACLHSKSPRSSCRENSTSAAPYFRGGDYPT